MKISDLPTPAVIIEQMILKSNIHSMQHKANQSGIQLRPHIKTHKMPTIAKMQMESGAIGITCAKVSEAEIMCRSGIRDILIAFPVIGQNQLERIMKLTETCRIIIGFDSLFGAEMIHEIAKKQDKLIQLYMIVNTGGNRDGVLPGDEALKLAVSIKKLDHVAITGIMTHEGHVKQAKNPDELQRLAFEAGQNLLETARLLRSSGIPVEHVSMGSSPVSWANLAVPGVTEWRPGTYVFNDRNEMLLVAAREECALSIMATVVSHPACKRFIIDSGSKVLASERPKTNGYGLIREAPNAIIERLYEEHGVVTVENEHDLAIGQRVRIIPNHVCPVINLMDYVYLCSGDKVIKKWKVEARGAVT